MKTGSPEIFRFSITMQRILKPRSPTFKKKMSKIILETCVPQIQNHDYVHSFKFTLPNHFPLFISSFFSQHLLRSPTEEEPELLNQSINISKAHFVHKLF